MDINYALPIAGVPLACGWTVTCTTVAPKCAKLMIMTFSQKARTLSSGVWRPGASYEHRQVFVSCQLLTWNHMINPLVM